MCFADERLKLCLCRSASFMSLITVNAVSLLLPLIGSAPQLAPAVSTCSSPKEFKTRQLIIIKEGRGEEGATAALWDFSLRCKIFVIVESVSGVKQC